MLGNLPDDACIELATQDCGTEEGLYAISIHTQAVDGNGMEACISDSGGESSGSSHIECAGGSLKCIRDISPAKISALCRLYNETYSYNFFIL